MQGTEIFLAGAEVETLLRALTDNETPYILLSFYYIHAFGQAGMIERMQREHPHIKWFLDSGAFTYSVQLGKGKPLPDPKKYVALYTQFVERFGERWCRIAEPDLDGIDGLDVTIEEVDAWRNMMLDKHPHLPIMPCWHGWRGWDDWAAYCADDRIKHLSFGRMSGSDANLRKLVLYAHEHGKTVHGFGFTKMNTSLVRGVVVPCDSVDSTSWVMGQKYGTLYIFRKDRLIVLRADQKRQRRRYASYLREIGCDPDKVCADDVREVRKANILAWRNLAVRFATLKADRERAEAAGHTGAGAYRSTDPRGPVTNRGILREFSTPPRADRSPSGRRPEREPVKPPQPERTPAAEAKPTREPTYRPRVLGAFGAPIKDPNADPFE